MVRKHFYIDRNDDNKSGSDDNVVKGDDFSRHNDHQCSAVMKHATALYCYCNGR